MQEKLKTCRDLSFRDFNMYIVTTKASEFIYLYIFMSQLYISRKFDPIKKSGRQEFHIWQRHLTIKVKHSYITKPVCVLFY